MHYSEKPRKLMTQLNSSLVQLAPQITKIKNELGELKIRFKSVQMDHEREAGFEKLDLRDDMDESSFTYVDLSILFSITSVSDDVLNVEYLERVRAPKRLPHSITFFKGQEFIEFCGTQSFEPLIQRVSLLLLIEVSTYFTACESKSQSPLYSLGRRVKKRDQECLQPIHP
jgi:hypothetical protein